MNSMILVIPLHSLNWSIHTKDESKRGTAFAFIFGVNWLWHCGVTASFGVFFMKCNGMTSFMEFMPCKSSNWHCMCALKAILQAKCTILEKRSMSDILVTSLGPNCKDASQMQLSTTIAFAHWKVTNVILRHVICYEGPRKCRWAIPCNFIEERRPFSNDDLSPNASERNTDKHIVTAAGFLCRFPVQVSYASFLFFWSWNTRSPAILD